MTDELTPTPEALRHGEWDEAAVYLRTGKTAPRRGYRRLSPLEALAKRGTITQAQADAGAKLETHWLGSLGVDVSRGDGGGEPIDYPRTYHAQKVAEARRALLPSEWTAVFSQVEGLESLEHVGKRLSSLRGDMARSYASATLSTGLSRLAQLWGITRR